MGMIKSALFTGLFLCSSSALGLSQAAGEEPIRIGVISSLSGPFAQLGEDSVDGVKIALEEVGYQIGGREIQLFIEDDGADRVTMFVIEGSEFDEVEAGDEEPAGFVEARGAASADPGSAQ